jgi:alcohol dehydrogenase class IV
VSRDFVWRDAGRTVVFRHQGVASAVESLREHGFERFDLISTSRGLGEAPELGTAATAVHEVGPGQVPELAAALLGSVGGNRLVALGGGRPIDVAKAVASVTRAKVAAIPTTMSGAEMTAIHRLPTGTESRGAATVRPSLVLADPLAMTSLPERRLRFSSMNALAHGADSIYTPLSNPVSEMTAIRGAESISAALDQPPQERDRASLALGSILCGYAIDSARFGLHHVVCQTLVRSCGTPHAETNAAILPRAASFLANRLPDRFEAFATAIGATRDNLEDRLLALAGNPPPLSTTATEPARREEAIDQMLTRPELTNVPAPSLTKVELAELVDDAW